MNDDDYDDAYGNQHVNGSTTTIHSTGRITTCNNNQRLAK